LSVCFRSSTEHRGSAAGLVVTYLASTILLQRADEASPPAEGRRQTA
jgi:hypothetical protein